MRVGDEVEARVNCGEWCSAQVIAVYEDMVTVAGESEIALAISDGRKALGICLPLSLVRAKEKAKNS